jgi:hypothetical protein
MSKSAGRYRPRPEILAFSAEWETVLDHAIANRMRSIGVPDAMIGIRGLPYEDPGAFVRTHAVGGSNNNIPGRGIMGDGPGINVDLAVLDQKFTPMLSVQSWATARLRDRIDAVIAHEYTEVCHDVSVSERTPHQYAIELAPETSLRISDRARQILREYRRIATPD